MSEYCEEHLEYHVTHELKVKRLPGMPTKSGKKVGRPRRKEDEYVNSEGYVMMRVETPNIDGVKAVWRTKARVLMERKLGRALYKHEKVYYKDGNKLNLAMSNLELRVTLPRGESIAELECPHCGKKYEEPLAD
jgi:hypothetical protein